MTSSNYNFRINPLFSIWTVKDFINEYPTFKPDLPLNANSFLLVHKNHTSKGNIVSLDIPTANCIFSIEQGSKEFKDKKITLLKSLVFDNIIQVQNRKKKFIGGPNSDFIDLKNKTFSTTKYSLAKQSENAIKYAWHFKHLSIDELVQKLYSYGTMPLHQHLANNLCTPKKVMNWLKANKTTSLSKNYKHIPISSTNKFWLYWQHKNLKKSSELLYKIYVSPNPEDMPKVFHHIAEACDKLSVPLFKIGSTSIGIHRPDKMVLYFNDMEAIKSFTNLVSPILSSYKAQGVPFTFPLLENSILSYGIEPTEGYTTSWRIYVSKIIAKTLKLYSFEHKTLNVDAILLKLKIHGIETLKWNSLC